MTMLPKRLLEIAAVLVPILGAGMAEPGNCFAGPEIAFHGWNLHVERLTKPTQRLAWAAANGNQNLDRSVRGR